MQRIIAFLFLMLLIGTPRGTFAADPTFYSLMADTNGVVQRPYYFWEKTATNDTARFSNAVRRVNSAVLGSVISVNGKVGNVLLTTTDIPEGTNLYWTAARSNALFVSASGGASSVAAGTNIFIYSSGTTSIVNAAVSHQEVNSASNVVQAYAIAVSNLTWSASNSLNAYVGSVSNNVITTSNVLQSYSLSVSNAGFAGSNALWTLVQGVSNNVITTSNVLQSYSLSVSNNAWVGSNSLSIYITGVSNNAWIGSNALWQVSDTSSNALFSYITGVSNNVITTSNVLQGYYLSVSNWAFNSSNILWGYTAAVSNNVITTSNLLWGFTSGVSNNVITTSNVLQGFSLGVSNNVITTSNVLWGYANASSNAVWVYANSSSNSLWIYTEGVSNAQWTASNALYVSQANYLPLAGGTLSGAALSASSTTNGPANNELVTAGWVRSKFNVGASYYSSGTAAASGTNADQPNQILYTFQSDIPASSARAYVVTDFLTNSGYVGAVRTTNTFQSISGPATANAYFGFINGGGTPTLTIRAEFYLSYDATNWFNEVWSGYQNIVNGTTNLYQFSVDIPTYTSTNSSGFYIQRRYRVGTVGGTGATRTLYVLIGTNAVSGTSDASHVTMQSPTATSGNAYLANSQTFTGTNLFASPIVSTSPTNNLGTNVSAVTFYGALKGNADTATSATTAGSATSASSSSNLVGYGQIALTNGTRQFFSDGTHTVITNTATLTSSEWTAGSQKEWYNGATTITIDKTNGNITASGVLKDSGSYPAFNLAINATGTNCYVSVTNGNLQYLTLTNAHSFTILDFNTNNTETIRLELRGSNTVSIINSSVTNAAVIYTTNYTSVILLDRAGGTNVWFAYRLR